MDGWSNELNELQNSRFNLSFIPRIQNSTFYKGVVMDASRNILIHRTILFVVLLCIGGCTTPDSKPLLSIDAQAEALSHFSLSLLAKNSGDLDSASHHITLAIQIDPDESTLYPIAISIALQQNNNDLALTLSEDLLRRHPDTLLPHLLLAQLYASQNDSEKAQAILESAVTDFPEEADPYLSLSQLFISTDNLPQAIQTLESALDSHDNHAEILDILGALYINYAQDTQDQTESRDLTLKGIRLLEKSLTISPSDDPIKWEQLGYAQLEVEKLDDARDTFEKAYERAPEDLFICKKLFDLSIHTEHFERALELCEELPNQTGTDPELWLQYLAENSTPEHQASLIEYIQKKIQRPNLSPVYLYTQLAALYIERDDLTKAETALTEALVIHPGNHILRSVKAYLHTQQQRYEEAYKIFNLVQAEAADDHWIDNPFFTINFMVAAQKSGHPDKAAKTLLSTYTNNPAILNHYIQTQFNENSPDSTQSAIDILHRFRQLQPGAAEIFYYLSLLQTEQEEYDKALENAHRFENLAETTNETKVMLDGFFYYQYAALHERTGDFEAAERFFRKSIELGEPTIGASAKNYIAYMWAEQGKKLEMGIDLVQQALSLEPENPAYLDTLGWIYYMQGRYQEALTKLTAASQLLQTEADIWEHIGETYLKLGDLRAAVEHWKKALEISPNEPRLIERIEQNQISSKNSPVPADSLEDTPSHP